MAETEHSSLAQFAATQDEASFCEIVRDYSGLVYSGALRRTRNPQLAEEITQNVFIALAKKAKQVATHQSFTAWLFTATRLEAARRMRELGLHKQKLEAYAVECNSDRIMNTSDADSWREVLPDLYESLDRLGCKDREVILARYFSGQSYREIATVTGITEAACKMRARRALEKLQRWMGKRGVTLSVSVIATGLAEEFANAAPTHLIASLPAKALALAPAGPTNNLVGQSIFAMNLTKPSIAVLAVFVCTSVPFAIQRLESKTLQLQIDTLRSSVATAQVVPESRWSTRERLPPIKGFLASLEKPLKAEQLIQEMTEAMESHDIARMVRVMIPIGRLSNGDLHALTDEVAATDTHGRPRTMILQLLADLDSSERGYQRLFERIAASENEDPHELAALFGQWATSDYPTALSWFREHRHDDSLQGKGLDAAPVNHMLSQLCMVGVNRDPDTAVELAMDVDSRFRQHLYTNLITKLVPTGGEGEARALRLIEAADASDRHPLVQAALHHLPDESKDLFMDRLPLGAMTPPTPAKQDVQEAEGVLRKAQATATNEPAPIHP